MPHPPPCSLARWSAWLSSSAGAALVGMSAQRGARYVSRGPQRARAPGAASPSHANRALQLLRRQIESSSAAQLYPKGGTVEVQPERATVAIVEFVFDLDGADPAATSVAHRAGPEMHLQPDWSLSRQVSIVELAADQPLQRLAIRDRAHAARSQQSWCHPIGTVPKDLDAFSTEHQRCGDLDAGVDDVMVWIACDCGASMRRRVDEPDDARRT
jgi:hypothetical protein